MYRYKDYKITREEISDRRGGKYRGLFSRKIVNVSDGEVFGV